MSGHVAFERDGPLGVITLNRPEKRNALSLALMREVIACLEAVERSPEIRAVVLAAAGSVFSAGHDLQEMVDRDLAAYRELFDACTRMMEAVQRIPQPVIAKVQGMATAAGCQLVATCDLAVAAESASFATPGVRIGLFCTTPMVALTRAIGRKRAMRMLLTGQPIDARTAADWGLVNEVVPAERLDAACRDLAARIAQASPLVTGLGKQAFYAQIDLDQEKAYAYAREVMSMNALAGDAHEGITAFLEKREPCWKGR
ncbi:MAG: enoyl-CoA hydratase [Armatimonadetes bacterium]|nr:enoyl-CoA hydratase [Armatimonadota bacterium]